MTGVVVAAVLIGLPALAFTLWPLVRRRDGRSAFLSLPPDAREQLGEQKGQILRALREIEFEHEAGHISDDDHRELRARYETEAAAVLAELDRLGAASPEAPPARAAGTVAAPSAWTRPAAIAVAAVAMVVFGVAIGVGIVRYSAPEPPGTGPGAAMSGGGAVPGTALPLPPPSGVAGLRPPPGDPASGGTPPNPEMLARMLDAARQALFAGNYSDAMAAYQAILRRDPRNVDAITGLGLIVAIGGHVDSALETFDRALAINPDFPPALLYRGQALNQKGDSAGAIRMWEKWLSVAPPGQDAERVKQMIAEARARAAAGPPVKK